MHLRSHLTTATLLATHLVAAQQCTNSGNLTDAARLEIGEDGPADLATTGYNVNNFALNVRDLDASMQFYGEILGLRHIFTYHISPILDLVYMAHSAGGRNGTGYQTGDELYRYRTNIQGIVKLLHRKDCNDITAAAERLQPSIQVPNTFSHYGLVVPNITATQERVKQYNVTVVKEFGQAASPRGVIADAFGVGDVSDEEAEEIAAGLEVLGLTYALMIEDPDGNLIEVLPLNF